jgi:hypothetical protein
MKLRIFSALAVIVLAAASLFAQDGRTKVNFSNHTGDSVRFMLNGNPACTGDVIPNGFCTEPVNPGTYTASATNGRETTGGQTFSIEYGGTYTYTVYVQESAAPVLPGLVLVSDLDYHKGFTVNAPVDLTAGAPLQGTTDQGKPWTGTQYAATLPNGDAYMVQVAEYGFALSTDDLDRGTNGFAGAVKGTVTSRDRVTVSGFPAETSVIEATVDGTAYRFGLLLTIRGNTAYLFVFGTDLAAPGTNMDDVKTFFTSARLN